MSFFAFAPWVRLSIVELTKCFFVYYEVIKAQVRNKLWKNL